MLNRLTQLANMIGNLNILKPFQDNQNPTKASEIAKQYNEEQDLIRNEMGKMDDTSAEYQQLASLLRESEQEEQEAVSALTYENQSEEYKTASSTVDDVIDKLGSFAQDDSDLSSLLDERTGIIKNIVAKENELKNAKDEDEIQKIKDEIEKLYKEKAEKEENIYDYIKENPKYESVSTNLKSAIDSLKKVRGTKETKKETDAAGDGGGSGGGGTDLSTTSNNGNDGGDKDTTTTKFAFESNLPDIGSIDVSALDLKGIQTEDGQITLNDETLTELTTDDLYKIQGSLSSYDTLYAEQSNKLSDGYKTVGEYIDNFTNALNDVNEADIENKEGYNKAKTEREGVVENIKTQKEEIETQTENIKDNLKEVSNVQSELTGLGPEPSRAGFYTYQEKAQDDGEESEGEAKYEYVFDDAAYNAAVSAWQEQYTSLQEKLDTAKQAVQDAKDALKKAQEEYKKQCDALEKVDEEIIACLKNADELNQIRQSVTADRQEGQSLAQEFITASSEVDAEISRNYANLQLVNGAILTREANLAAMANNIEQSTTKNEAGNVDFDEQLATANAIGYALRYRNMASEDKVKANNFDLLCKACKQAGFGEIGNDPEKADEYVEAFLSYAFEQAINANQKPKEEQS